MSSITLGSQRTSGTKVHGRLDLHEGGQSHLVLWFLLRHVACCTLAPPRNAAALTPFKCFLQPLEGAIYWDLLAAGTTDNEEKLPDSNLVQVFLLHAFEVALCAAKDKGLDWCGGWIGLRRVAVICTALPTNLHEALKVVACRLHWF